MNTTKECLRELKALVATAKLNIYRRVELAMTVLSDLNWIAAEHSGSDLKACDALQSEFFPDLNGYIPLGKLMAMYRTVPEPRWGEVRYDIAAVEAIYDAEHEPVPAGERGRRTAWKKIAEERAEEISRLEKRVGKLEADNASLRRILSTACEGTAVGA